MLEFARDGAGPIRVDVTNVVIGGFTARDEAAIQHHVEEMRAIGVRSPDTFPVFFRTSAEFVTQADGIQVLGTDSSGEVEAVVVALEDGLWLTVGSDHTDRKVESYSINVSKQMCAKVIGRTLWRFSEVAGHWDRLMLRAWTTRDGTRMLYQEGPLALMRHANDLIQRHLGPGNRLEPGTVLFCGTLGANGPLVHSDRFEMEIEDPVLGRRIAHAYDIRALPVLTF